MSRALKRVLGGMASGAGEYLVDKAKTDAQTRRDEILHNREMAIKSYEQGNRLDLADKQGEIQKQTIAATGVEARITDRARAGYQLTETQARIAGDKEVVNLRNQHDITKFNLDTAATMALARFNASEKAKDVSNYQVNDEGYIVGFTPDGKTVNTGQKAGAKPKAEGEEGGLAAFRPGASPGERLAPAAAKPSGGSVAVGTVIIGANGKMKMGPDGKWQKL